MNLFTVDFVAYHIVANGITGEVIEPNNTLLDRANRTIIKIDVIEYMSRYGGILDNMPSFLSAREVGYWYLDWEGVEEYQEPKDRRAIPIASSTAITYNPTFEYTVNDPGSAISIDMNAIPRMNSDELQDFVTRYSNQVRLSSSIPIINTDPRGYNTVEQSMQAYIDLHGTLAGFDINNLVITYSN